MQETRLSPDERTVIDALLGDERERTLPAELDHAVYSLEQRGWVSLMSRGAVIDGEREYTLALTPFGRVARGDGVRARIADAHVREHCRARAA